MTTTSSFRSTFAGSASSAARALGDSGALMQISLTGWDKSSGLRGKVGEAFAKHAIERRERMDDVGERRERYARLDGQHELADDFAGARRHQRRADQHAAVA